jgi:CubicO group peptidase (beta-lactamase class C family)
MSEAGERELADVGPLSVDAGIAPRGLDDHLRTLMRERRIPGLQLAAVKDGKITFVGTRGFANLEHGIAVDRRSIFSVNTIAQAFTGVALLQLADLGRLCMGDRAADHVDALPDAWKTITLRQLATMTSGLPEILTYVGNGSIGLVGDGSEHDAWATIQRQPLQFAPGDRYQFTRTNYALLDRIVARASGMSFDQFVAERQFLPAGMENTLFADDRDLIPNRADTYARVSPDGSAVDTMFRSYMNWPSVLHAMSGLHSTAEDLAQWLVALLEGRLLDSARVEALWETVSLPDGGCGSWGIGWSISRENGARVIAPAGGCKAQIALYPSGLALILVTNLIGAFSEQIAAYSALPIDISFMSAIARYFQ